MHPVRGTVVAIPKGRSFADLIFRIGQCRGARRGPAAVLMYRSKVSVALSATIQQLYHCVRFSPAFTRLHTAVVVMISMADPLSIAWKPAAICPGALFCVPVKKYP